MQSKQSQQVIKNYREETYMSGTACPAVPLNGFITYHMFCHFPVVFIHLYKILPIYMRHIHFYGNKSNITGKILHFYMKGMTKNSVKKVGMQDCSCPLNNPFHTFNKWTKEGEHASSQAGFYYSPMEHPPTLFPLHFFAASDCRRI